MKFEKLSNENGVYRWGTGNPRKHLGILVYSDSGVDESSIRPIKKLAICRTPTH